MSHVPFSYEKKLFEACAKKANTSFAQDDASCQALFRMHQSHYNRPLDELSGDRFRRLLDNVLFVHEHNSKAINHRVTLNQFSDVDEKDLPLYDSSIFEGGLDFGEDDVELISLSDLDNDSDFLNFGHRRKLSNEKKTKVHPFIHENSERSQESVLLRGNTIKPLSSQRRRIASETELINSDYNLDEYDWTKNLNWATSDNPDGVSIVNPPSDQGPCGSCWAFAATGSLESNIVRLAGLQSLMSKIEEFSVEDSELSSEQMEQSVSAAQQAETEVFDLAKLSVQELVDCDTKYDQGCIGGNPLLAFPFIRRYGLVASEVYPYVAMESSCRAHLLRDPVATVESWGMLEPNHEDNMETVIRKLGPIAVGLNGSDQSFLNYEGGIFQSDTCNHSANHAMLIVGYGEEEREDGEGVTKYWVARNSWGRGWGENGYIRIKRGTGMKGDPGECGIARNPSIALGGSLVENAAYLSQWKGTITGQDKHKLEQYKTYGASEKKIDGKSFDLSQDNPVLSAGCIAVVIALFWVIRSAMSYGRSLEGSRRLIFEEDQDHISEGNGMLLSKSCRNTKYGTLAS